jgi:phage baseplate assembly protein W
MKRALEAAGAWPFPLHLDPTGRMPLVTGRRELEEAMYLILATRPGERRMRPDFGCDLPTVTAGGQDDEAAHRDAEQAAQTALARWEPRVEVRDVRAVIPPDAGSGINLEITYGWMDTGEVHTFTYRDTRAAPGTLPDERS